MKQSSKTAATEADPAGPVRVGAALRLIGACLARRVTSFPVVVGLFVVLASLIHVPVRFPALNSFDPPKRFVWALLVMLLATRWAPERSRLSLGGLVFAFAIPAWMIVRTLLRPRPTVELDVLATWLLPALLFVGATAMGRGGVRSLGALVAVAGLVQGVLMLCQRCGVDPLFSATTVTMSYAPDRMVGTIGNRNQAVDFLALCAAGPALACPWAAPARVAAFLLVLAVDAVSGSRGGLLALTAAFLASELVGVALRGSWPHRKRLAVAAMVVVGACEALFLLVAAVPVARDRCMEALTNAGSSVSVGSRLLMSRVALRLIAERPWVGWGAGEYAFQYLDRLGDLLPAQKTHEILRLLFFAREAHNDWLQFAAEFGLVGVLLVAALLLAAVPRPGRGGAPAAAVTSWVFVLAYMVVLGLVGFPWQTNMAGPLAGLLLGYLWPSADRGFSAGEDACRPAASACPTRGIGGEGDAPPARRSLLAKAAAEPRVLGPALGWVLRCAFVGMALAVVLWQARETFVNSAVPHAMERGGASEMERFVPRTSYAQYALLGSALAVQGDYVQALRCLEHASSGYGDVLLLSNTGHVLSKMGRWPQAAGVYERWARTGIDHSNALHNLSIAYEQSGEFGKAADALSQEMGLWPHQTAQAIRRLAVLEFRAGRLRDALAMLHRRERRWQKADSSIVAEIHNLVGALHLALGEVQDAERAFRSALDADPLLESAKKNLAQIAAQPAEP